MWNIRMLSVLSHWEVFCVLTISDYVQHASGLIYANCFSFRSSWGKAHLRWAKASIIALFYHNFDNETGNRLVIVAKHLSLSVGNIISRLQYCEANVNCKLGAANFSLSCFKRPTGISAMPFQSYTVIIIDSYCQQQDNVTEYIIIPFWSVDFAANRLIFFCWSDDQAY